MLRVCINLRSCAVLIIDTILGVFHHVVTFRRRRLNSAPAHGTGSGLSQREADVGGVLDVIGNP